MKMGSLGSLILCGSLVFFLLSGLTAGADTIPASQTLVDGETLNSSSGVFQLGFFSPGRSTGRYLGIWYRNVDVQTVVWVANRNKPVIDSSGSLLLNSTGGLVLTSRGGAVVWSANTTGPVQNLVLQLLDNGNLVLRSAVDVRGSSSSGNFIWQSFDYPTDTFLPEMKLGWDLQTGINRRFSSWSSPDDPSPGDFTWGLENINFPETTARKGASKYFRSGPWNGLRFSGAPQQSPNPIFWFDFVSNKDEVYYMYRVNDSSMLVRTTLNQSNYLWERSTWSPESQSWRVFLVLPKDYCDNYGLCGAYGKCVANNLPFCQCMTGFSPKSPNQWNTNDFLQGCVRNKPLNCPNSTDGFLKYSNIKLPDTTNCSVDATLSLKDCEKKCLSNCSCTAYANSDIRGRGSGCAMWFGDLLDMRQYPDAGQDIYIRMPASEIGKSRPKAWMIAVVVLAVAILCGLLLVICWFCRRKRNLTGNKEVSFAGQEHEGPEDDLELPLFDLVSISKATSNFSSKNKLGEGGFGPVFKGVLDDGHEIAVKRLSASSTQGMHEFKNEVIMIARLQHRNLVKLLGCCIQGEEKMLIYEYLHNKSLDAFIFDPSTSKLLDWNRRFHIICGVARGLLYLHQDSRLRIIHRDLKASNVLLDEEMNPKISDFGLARIFGGDQTEANTTRVVGTYGYMAPEYAIDGLFSVKSDVFSFGILILETVSGKRNRAFYHSNNSLVGHAWELYKTGESIELLDPSLVDTCTISEVLRCIHIGLLCLQEHPDDRPTMSSVVVMLSSDGPLAYPKKPGFLAERKFRGSSSLSSKHDSTSANDITFTLLQPR